MILILILTQTLTLAMITDEPPTPIAVEGTTTTRATTILIAGMTATNTIPIATRSCTINATLMTPANATLVAIMPTMTLKIATIRMTIAPNATPLRPLSK